MKSIASLVIASAVIGFAGGIIASVTVQFDEPNLRFRLMVLGAMASGLGSGFCLGYSRGAWVTMVKLQKEFEDWRRRPRF